ncbi:MAG: hypothetical protein AABX02_02320, partial [archaeon]
NNMGGDIQRIVLSEGGIVSVTGKEKDNYQTNIRMSGGGILIEKGCHLLSQLCYILDETPIRVRKAVIEYQGELDVDVHAEMIAPHGTKTIPIVFDISNIRSLKPLIRIEGKNSALEFNPQSANDPPVICSLSTGDRVPLTPLSTSPKNYTQAFYLKWDAFLSSVASKTKMNTRKTTSVMVTDIISSLYERTRD